ncbi:MAG: hypothetical protein CMJ64_26635 [Planctomycetaceae bacterium]|nr:hypothetical protein [Planctomycetaceae bacterium]
MSRLLRHLWLVLAAQVVVLACLLALLGRFRPEVVPDTASYSDFPLSEPRAALQQIRPFMYPLVLAFSSLLGADFAAVPFFHFIAHILAVLLFMKALQAWDCRPMQATVVASGLLWSSTLQRYQQCVAPDTLALSAAIAAISLLLMLVRSPNKRTVSLLLGVCLFATYQMRPAYLFMLPLMPLLAVPLSWLARPADDFDQQAAYRLATRLAVVAFVPLLLFAGLRWVVVGHFGLVAFGGYNAAGVMGQFLTAEMVPELPADVQPLAMNALQRRDALVARSSLNAEVTTSYTTIENRFDTYTWQIYAPAARDEANGDLLMMNSLLSRFARSIVFRKPRSYAIWIIKAGHRGIYTVFAELLFNQAVLLLLATYVVIQLRIVWLRRMGSLDSTAIDGDQADVTSTLFIVAIAFLFAKLALVIITTPPLGRFMEAASVFYPAVLASVVYDRAQMMMQRQATTG